MATIWAAGLSAEDRRIESVSEKSRCLPASTPRAASLRRLGSSPRRTMAAMVDLLLRRAPAAFGEVDDVLRGRKIVGRIMLSNGSAASQWVWTMSYHYHEDRTPTHGYEPTRDAAMKAFSLSWHRE